jgi:hypothetical protein
LTCDWSVKTQHMWADVVIPHPLTRPKLTWTR